ncbi:hypothetical protein [Anatilimnocola floriformis]|uniref:hypothetical protein n=1 Tax=Anatilimnocola floriformis TaxID=2948575 RepID=UPI0020C2A30B|nr:hypothetical protein [Anatilimnocola floriformis]
MYISNQPAEKSVRPEDRFVPVKWPFRVVDVDGCELGQFDLLADALAAFNSNDNAAAVSIGSYIVTRRREGGAA